MLLSACDPPEQAGEDPGAIAFRPGGVGTNGGVFLNTSVLGVDELDLNKQLHAEVKLVSIKIKLKNKLTALDQVWTVDGEMFGRVGGVTHRGAAFLNAEVRIRLFTQNHYNVEVPYTVSSYAAATPGDFPRYTLRYWDGSTHKYLCAPDSVEQAAALVLGDITVDKTTGDISPRANTLYLGCASGAVGKAPTWGYTPWDLGLPDFEAIVRMVRADYCGDGVSWTTPGRAVVISDVWGINSFPAATGPTEGIWGPNGLLCLGQPREPTVTASSVTCGGVAVPSCPADVSLATYPDALAWLKSAQ